MATQSVIFDDVIYDAVLYNSLTELSADHCVARKSAVAIRLMISSMPLGANKSEVLKCVE
jgi:hypothetical protein